MCFEEVSYEFQGCFKEVARKFQGSVLRKIEGGIKEVLIMSLSKSSKKSKAGFKCFNDASRLLQGSLIASWTFQGYFTAVS